MKALVLATVLLALSPGDEHRLVSMGAAWLLFEGVIALTALVILAWCFRQAPIWWDKWSKHRLIDQRRKQVMTDRERQLRELMTSIIGDGLLSQAADNKISMQEYKRLATWAGEDLDLPELIPATERSEEVKTQIRANLSRLKKVHPKLPDGKKALSLKKTS